MLSIRDLSVNAVPAPFCIPTDHLRFSWKLTSDRNAVYQSSYRILLKKAETVLWDSGPVASKKSVDIPCPAALPPRSDISLSVEVTDNYGESAGKTIALVTALRPEDWSAVWIKPRRHVEGWAPYLRTKFDTWDGEILHARLYVSGLGCGEYYVNNHKISEDLVDPPMTNYEREVFYRVYDVTGYLGKHNALTALLGEGWYSQSRVWSPLTYKYGDVCLCAELEICYRDGRTQTIATNSDDWAAKYSPITLNNLYAGENYDCRLETPDHADPNGSDEGWEPVIADTVPKGPLTFCQMPPVRIIRALPAVSVKPVSGVDDGAWIIDIGENVAGFVEFHLPESTPGAQYVFRFAETVNPDGSLDFRSAGTFATQCIQQDVYIARGDKGGETWRPRFTYHAFRYVELTGYYQPHDYGAMPPLSIATGLVLSTDLTQAGTFSCANENVDRLQKIMMSTFRSNYHGFPEDCPGREKCGWLGDAQVVCNTGMFNYQMQISYEKYLHDIRTTTEVYGQWNMIAPGKRDCGEASPLWGCAQIIIPYYLWRYYGDETAVRDNWDLMERWVEHEANDAKDYIITRGLGDWCPPTGHDSPRRIPVEESSTQMFFEICIRMREMCEALGLPGAEKYAGLAAHIKEAYNRKYWLPEKHRYSTWGSCGVALQTGLYPDGEHDALVRALAVLMKKDDYFMSTGIYGNKYLVPALAAEDLGDLALEYLFTRRHPSFGTMMDEGATSLLEAVELKCIGQPRSRHMGSMNHPMHAGFGYYLYTHVAGIQPLTPGFETFVIEPCRFEGIPSAEMTFDSPYGTIAVSFVRNGGKTAYTFTVPANATGIFRGKTYASGTYSVTE